MLLASAESASYGQILDMISAIMFFGTPHHGSAIAKTAKFWAGAVNLVGVPLRANLLSDLSVFSQNLAEISVTFRNKVERIAFVSFYETQATAPLKDLVSTFSWKAAPDLAKYINSKIVPKLSALLGLPEDHEKVIGIDSDHRAICQFGSDTSSQYVVVRGALLSLVKNDCKREFKSMINPID